MTNGFAHFEINSKVPEKLHAFYQEVFGWSIDAGNPMGYGLVDTKAGGISGGIGPTEDAASTVTAYIGVADMEAALKAVEDNGGKAVMPTTEVMDGQVVIALFADPQGNVVGLVKNDPSRPAEEAGSTTAGGKHPVEHIEILGTDFPALSKFYASTFGWSLQPMGDTYAVWGPADGRGSGGGLGASKGEPTLLFYVTTDDVGASLKAVEKAGGTVVMGPETVPGAVEFAAFKDPEGNLVGVARSLS